MKILAIGDIVGVDTVEFLSSRLWDMRKAHNIDFVAANGENATDIHGLSHSDALALINAGVDVITGGNHIWRHRNLYTFLDDSPNIIRPANCSPLAPGNGYTVLNAGGWKILCINVLGSIFMEPCDNPFHKIESILKKEDGNYDFSLLDIHAEATSEKLALARYFDGRINIVFGTHTHVATADEQILPGGTAYITDLGMSGPVNGILGVKSAPVIEKYLTNMPQHFSPASGEIKINGAVFELDADAGEVKKVSRITF